MTSPESGGSNKGNNGAIGKGVNAGIKRADQALESLRFINQHCEVRNLEHALSKNRCSRDYVERPTGKTTHEEY